jgi:HlyD family secretion protein
MAPSNESPTVKNPSSARRPSRAKWYIIGAIAVLGGGAFIAKRRGGGEQPIAVTTEQAVVMNITQLVTATGKIQPETEVKIAPEVSGEIVELPFREGADVKEGDLLVRIRADNYQFQLTQQEAGLASARASAADSEARLQKATDDFRRSQELYAQGLISDSDFAAARVANQSAIASYESAQASIIRAEGSVNQARDQLNKTVIYSPINGKVIALSNEVGERVAGTGQYGGANVMRVADLDNMELQVRVNENDIVNVSVGNRAVINVDALPGRIVNGRVTEISNSPQTTTTAQNADDVTNFLVKIAITDRGLELRPGMSATADIETRTVTQVVAVPIQSVTVRAGTLNAEEFQKQQQEEVKAKSGNELDAETERELARRDRERLQRVVFVRNDDTVEMRTVETGIADLTHIEIQSGLRAGDEVVSGSYTAITRQLRDGSQIRIETPPEKK